MKIEFDNIYQCDVMEGLKNLPDGCIDVIITRPPYNKMGLQGDQRAANWNKNIVYGNDKNIDNKDEEYYQRWQIDFLNECHRVLKRNGSMFYNHKNRIWKGMVITPYEWIRETNFFFRQEIIWQRNSSPNIHPCRFIPDTEKIYWLTKTERTPNFKRNPNCEHKGEVWKISAKRNTEHPAPFPIEIPDNILKCIPNWDNDKVVLDPFMGSGTTAISAKKNGFHYIGFELFPEYIDMANNRLKQFE